MICGIEVESPLLVPSFSSRFETDISAVFASVKHGLGDVALVSAFDLYHGRLDYTHVYTTSATFIDCGVYEARHAPDPHKGYFNAPQLDPTWTLQDYESVLSRLNTTHECVIVSYDADAGQSLTAQAAAADALFTSYPTSGTDFLIKPQDADARFLDCDDLVTNIAVVSAFSILGITEAELGASALERCRNLCRIRRALNDCGLDTPIHVLGCLDPVTVLSYFLCGADIFDGLVWLRFPFIEGVPTYAGTAAITAMKWKHEDTDLAVANWIRNLDYLRDLQAAMSLFCCDQERSVFDELGVWTPAVFRLVTEATEQEADR